MHKKALRFAPRRSTLIQHHLRGNIMAKNVVKVARSAKTGRFITKTQAKRNPNTTVVETVKRGKKNK